MARNSEWAVVHATQTIHYQYFGWNRTSNRPSKNHKYDLLYINGNHMSLNWVDGPAYLYNCGGVDIFLNALDFIEYWIEKRRVLVHCDQGFSRSPSVCLLYLSKRMGRISNESYDKAKHELERLYPCYNPGGIGRYLNENWERLH